MTMIGVTGKVAVDEGASDVGSGDEEDGKEEDVLMVTDKERQQDEK